jgi:hypothetical protein
VSDVNNPAVVVAAVSSFLVGADSGIRRDGGYHTVQFAMYGLIIGLWR